MTAGLATLVLGYVLSQFYRAFLAVLSPVLAQEINAAPDDLAVSLGLWYLAFAAMQIPVGRWLDAYGPRRIVAPILAIGGGGGAICFALAQGPMAIHFAMIAIGIGCSPVLMGGYYYIARTMPVTAFGTMAGLIVALGSLGNIAGSAPLVAAIDSFGWRQTVWALAAVTFATAAAIWVILRDPERAAPPQTGAGSLLDVLRIPTLWAILALIAVNYIPASGIRGVWAGPLLTEVHGATKQTIGVVTLIMGLAMVAGNFAYGAAERITGSHKKTNLIGTACLLAGIIALAIAPDAPIWQITLILAAIGFFGSAFPALIAHGRAFFPPHLVGRGVTLLNMFSIAGSAFASFGSRPVYRLASEAGDPVHTYGVIMWFFALPVAIGLIAYTFSKPRPDL
ncbi:MFS transporter [Albirhodobacter sp. R86504]|uniref:MFS transporter n=1 Tax=Albirhodobacter sp. R86504 TaxID=3093848 RepID=UPI00366AAAB9